jgi:hypothetical protein
MRIEKWTLALAAAGVVSLPSALAEEQHQVLTALSQTTLSGYVDTSAIWQVSSPNGMLPGRTFDGADKSDGFNLHAVKLVLEKPLDEGNWSAGYKADLVFGPDANYYSTLVNGGAGPMADDFAVKQAYVALRAPVGNGLDIKLGVWDTLIGYEVFESGNNPNFSRSFGYALEPTHHTGVLASYHINDAVSISGGVANGWTGGINDRNALEDRKSYLGSITITLPESTGAMAGTSIYAGFVTGENTAKASGIHPDTHSYYVGTTINTPLEGLSFGLAFDYRDNGVGVFGVVNSAWAGALYASYQATEKLRFNFRADYVDGDDGTFYDVGADGIANGDNELGSLTATIDYSLWANVITRLELRWDHSFQNDDPYNGNPAMGIPGDEDDALTVAANFIYKF